KMFAWRSPFGFVVESVNSNIPNQKAERLLFRLVAAMPRYAGEKRVEGCSNSRISDCAHVGLVIDDQYPGAQTVHRISISIALRFIFHI
ncbi:MAG: hypothetical protein H7834_02705, partial [Magnetococcus sp. YQC-9]